MTRYVYPRLPLATAQVRLSELSEAHERGGLDAVAQMAGCEHERAAPVPTGGQVASVTEIDGVRETVLDALAPWLQRGVVPRSDSSTYDSTLGRALHSRLQIVPSDAAHDGVWSFLTLIVLPEIAVLRFPEMHSDRMLGTARNALRRTWQRQEVLADVLPRASRPLGEDELVGLFERTSLARNRRLVRRLARAVLAYEGPNRSRWARDLYKRVTFLTGPRLLDALSDDELDVLIEDARSENARPIDHEGQRAEELARSAVGSTRQVDVPGEADAPESDLPGEFRESLLGIYRATKRDLNYNARFLLDMISEYGGVRAAERLVLADHASSGFEHLWEHRRLDLSVEALVADPRFSTLFDYSVIERAQHRLVSYGYGG